MLAKTHTTIGIPFTGYIAGTGDGIVTVMGSPASRHIYLLDSDMQLLRRTTSLPNGHYIFIALDPDAEYLVVVRDYKKELEPFAWDCVKPANDLTLIEQQALWQSWQT